VPSSSATVLYIALGPTADNPVAGLGVGGYPAWQSAVTGM
jgi:hypothetical protein